MGLFNGKEATVWMRAIRPHTYEGVSQDEGAIYLAHDEMVETIEILKFAVREAPPRRAQRAGAQPAEPATPTPPPPPPSPQPHAPAAVSVAPEPDKTFMVGITATADLPPGRVRRS